VTHTFSNLGGPLRQDFTYAIRLLRLNPGFAATAILSLALGIAANTSIFTLVDQILLRLLPVEKPRELVQFRMEGGRVGSQNGDGVHTFSYPLYIAFRDRNTVFTGVTGQYADRLSLLGGDRAEMVDAGWGTLAACSRLRMTSPAMATPLWCSSTITGAAGTPAGRTSSAPQSD
jgi:hypothetical protein